MSPRDPDRRPLRHAQLAVVLLQVQFDEQPALATAEALDVLAREVKLGGGRLRADEVRSGAMIITPTLGQPNVQTSAAPAGWRLQTPDARTAATFVKDQVTLETGAYSTWDEFAEQFRGCLHGLVGVGAPTVLRRVGLRYVNRFSRPEGRPDWSGLIHQPFLPLPSDACGDLVSVSTVESRLAGQAEDGLDVILHFGVSVGELGRPEFVVDVDVFDQSARPWGLEALDARLEALNTQALRSFQAVVTDEMLALLGREEVGS